MSCPYNPHFRYFCALFSEISFVLYSLLGLTPIKWSEKVSPRRIKEVEEKKAMGEKKQYSEAFKREAIRLQASSGKPVAQIEQELGLSHGLLRYWKKRFQVSETRDGLELSEVEQLKAELRRTKRELEIVQQERDILKKTVGIFSKDTAR
jgi:transposase